MKTDALLCWPRHVDFPLFRYLIEKYRDCFNEVYIALVRGLADRDISDFLYKAMPFVKFIRPPDHRGDEDWRDMAVRDLLIFSKAESVLFLEQDFLFNDRVANFIRSCDRPFVGIREGERVHPAFALVSRELVDKTSRDFVANPPAYDHFGKFFIEIGQLTDMRFLDEFALQSRRDFVHMNGLTQNYMCFKEGQPFFRRDEFLTYNHLIQKLDIPQHREFMELSKQIEEKRGIDDVALIRNFFPKKEE